LKRAHFFLFLTLIVGFFGMAVLDATTEIIPIRPYSGIFAPAISGLQQTGGISNSHTIIEEVLVVAVMILLVSSLIGPVANRTTGITIPHSGFTVNPNITASPGLVPLTQLLPFLLVAVAFFGGLAIFEKRQGAF
jgi:hypothetical protein